MSVMKRGDSPYWYVQFQFNGRTYIRSSRTTDKKSAERLEADWRARLHAEQYLGQRESISLEEAIRQYVASKEGTPNWRNLAAHSRVIAKRLPVKRAIEEIQAHDLEQFRRQRQLEGASPQTIKHCLGLIRCAWKYARHLGYRTVELDFPSVRTPKSKVRYLTEVEERRLLSELDPIRSGNGLKYLPDRDPEMRRNLQDAYDLVVLLLDTGARYSEIANIDWSRINLERREIHLWRSKVQNETILFMTDRAFDVLSRRSATRTTPWVFSNRSGGPRGYASQSIRKAIRNAGLQDVRIHTLRHTHASRLIQNGMSVYEVREILGHTDIKTTMRYAHLESKKVTSRARDVINRINGSSAAKQDAE